MTPESLTLLGGEAQLPAGLSVVVPVYNSAEILPQLVERLGEVLPLLAARHELILVNDGSRDGSWERVQALAAGRPWVRGFDLARNFGQHNALLAGIRQARFHLLVTMDDDLQHPPEEIVHVLARLEQGGFDVVYGCPRKRAHSSYRNLGSRLTRLALSSSMGAELARDVSAFRAMRTGLRTAFESYRGAFISIDVLLTWATHRFGSVEVEHHERAAGRSNYDFRRLVTQAFNMLTGFSTLPLQLASWVGFFFTSFGVLVLVYVVGRYLLEGGDVPGFAFLASIIALFSGAQLFALGMIGEYLARMHFRLMGRPPYLIRSDTLGAPLPARPRTPEPQARQDPPKPS